MNELHAEDCRDLVINWVGEELVRGGRHSRRGKHWCDSVRAPQSAQNAGQHPGPVSACLTTPRDAQAAGPPFE